MPPTTGGSTSGSSISERTTRWPGNDVRASTSAIGTPRSRQSAVDASEVRRLSLSASSDSCVVTRAPNRGQSTRVAIATSGSRTKTAPRRAGTKTHPGTPDQRLLTRSWSRLREPRSRQHLLPLAAGHELDELAGQVRVLAAGERGDRV